MKILMMILIWWVWYDDFGNNFAAGDFDDDFDMMMIESGKLLIWLERSEHDDNDDESNDGDEIDDSDFHGDFDDDDFDFDMMMIESGKLLIRLERSVKQEGTQTLGHSDIQS